jgi:DNA-binding transcriptional ArsR family regulator
MQMGAFQLMSEPIRRRIVEILASGEHSAGLLAEAISQEFTVTRQATSHHLAIMLACGYVSRREEWPAQVYRLEETLFDDLYGAVDWLDQLWARRYGWLDNKTHDPVPHWAEPMVRRPYPRPAPGETRRGMRGRGVRTNPWAPMP